MAITTPLHKKAEEEPLVGKETREEKVRAFTQEYAALKAKYGMEVSAQLHFGKEGEIKVMLNVFDIPYEGKQ